LAAAAPPAPALPEVAHREPELDTDAIDAAAQLLAAARKPMLMCGAGAQHAATEVLALAEMLQAPVTAFRSGRGVVPEDHSLGVAAVAARELWDEVDVLVGIGSRLEMPYMRWRDMLRHEPRPSRPKLIRIDIDANELERFPADVGIVAGALYVLRGAAIVISFADAFGISVTALAIAAATAAALAVPLLFVLPGLCTLGITDTWYHYRRRLAAARQRGSPPNQT